MPPEPAIPCAQNPAATQNPSTVARPEDELAVGGEGLGSVDQRHDLGVGERRHARDRRLEEVAKRSQSAVEELIVEVARDAAESPGRGVALVAARDEPAALAAEVDEEGRVAHGRHVARQPRVLRDHVLVGHRDDRHVYAGEAADLVGVDAAGVHDDLALDRSPVGLDSA